MMGWLWLGYMFVIFGVCRGSFNLYLSAQEVKKLLGLNRELYYVQEGVINEYALNFIVPVPANISALHFTWQVVKEMPVQYSIGFNSSNPATLLEPKMNITKSGKIPSKVPGTFRITLPCSGKMSAEVDLSITFNFTTGKGSRKEIKQLLFRRKKICLKGETTASPDVTESLPEQTFVDEDLPHNQISSDEPRLTVPIPPIKASPHAKGEEQATETTPPASPILYVIAGCAAGAVMVLIVIGATVLVKKKKKSERRRVLGSVLLGGGARVADSSHQVRSLIPRPLSPHGNASDKSVVSSCASYATIQPVRAKLNTIDRRHEYCSLMGDFEESRCYLSRNTLDKKSSSSLSAEYDKKIDVQELNIDRSRISVSNIELEGAFGQVLFGTYRRPEGVAEEVLIKTVSERGAGFQASQLLKESSRFLGLSHRNIATPSGISISDASPYVVYSGKGLVNLKKFLQECGQPLDALTVCEIGLQISAGLQYLHRRRLVHKDVAARNCIVDEHLVVRIADAALSKDLFPSDYHCIGDNENRPIKWLAPECLTRGESSVASDVWSFGVLLWEVCTRGRQPYAEVDPFDQLSHLNSGYRLAPPPACPEQLYGAMAWCWAMMPHDRPTMTSMHSCMQDLRSNLARFI